MRHGLAADHELIIWFIKYIKPHITNIKSSLFWARLSPRHQAIGDESVIQKHYSYTRFKLL